MQNEYKHFVIAVYFQAKGLGDFEKKMRGSYWTALKMNWKVWTPFQFININFVPVQVCASENVFLYAVLLINKSVSADVC